MYTHACTCICMRVHVYACMYMYMHAKSLQLCLTLCDPMDCSPPGSTVHEILQARILKWVAIPFSRGSSPPRDQTRISFVCCVGRYPRTTSTPWEAQHVHIPQNLGVPKTSSILLAPLLPEQRLPACGDKHYEAPGSGSWLNRPDSQHLPLCALPATIL